MSVVTKEQSRNSLRDIFRWHNGVDEGASTSGIFVGSMVSEKIRYAVNADSAYHTMMVPGMYGGRMVWTARKEGDRTLLAKPRDLIVGDVMLGRTSSAYQVLFYVGGDKFINLTSGITEDTTTIPLRLERILSYTYYFAFVRPSMVLE